MLTFDSCPDIPSNSHRLRIVVHEAKCDLVLRGILEGSHTVSVVLRKVKIRVTVSKSLCDCLGYPLCQLGQWNMTLFRSGFRTLS